MAIDVEELYRRYGPMVLRRCRRLLREEEAAVDAMHDTFVELVRAAARLTDDAPSRLLFRMATNVCLNRLRTQRRHPEDADDELVARIAALGDEEDRHHARRLLDRLFLRAPVSSRTIAVLHLLDGLTHEEVAAQVGMSVSGVRKRLRALEKELGAIEGVAA